MTIRAGGHVVGDHGWVPASLVVETFDPSDHTVAEVKDHVGNDKKLAAEVLELEQAGKDRVSLVEALESVLEDDEEEG